ncbi:MAG: endonuclease/exonuclease/phosphatase family protein [Desulfobulbaceae bacterium]|nr:endonuclease/exonuclease/phosphatase family protein [Desulfobulbaceae bacterium]
MRGLTHTVPEHSRVLTSFGNSSAPTVGYRFEVLVWNIFKAKKSHWAVDFLKLIRGKDLVLLQEAFLRPAMLDVLEQLSHMRWELATGFTRRLHAINAGVMTGSRARPSDIFYLRSPSHEPLVRLPKMAIGCHYELQTSSSDLLVLNVHAINFVRFNKFKRQMRQLEKKIGRHNGPILLAGDFNTWLTRRSDFLQDMTDNLHMDYATFSPDRRSRYFGRVLDHVFVKGLKVVSASCRFEVRSSDHQPIELVLEVDQ